MPYADPTKKAERDRQYRLANRERTLARHRAYYLVNREARNADARARQIANPERTRAAHRKFAETQPARIKEIRLKSWKKCGAKHLKRFHDYRVKNKEVLAIKGLRYRSTDRFKAMATERAAARRAGLKRATPLWVDRKAIRQIYKTARSQKLVVDHIIPLSHPLVCGLHVPWNLQLLTRKENCAKGNRCEL